MDPKAGREREYASFARLALDGYVPAHQFNNFRGDREAKTRTAKLPCRRAVLLLECPEDRLLSVVRNTNTSVTHDESQADLFLGYRIVGDFHAHDYLAFTGELNGVAHQVQQH